MFVSCFVRFRTLLLLLPLLPLLPLLLLSCHFRCCTLLFSHPDR
jgi:hypothetical protein